MTIFFAWVGEVSEQPEGPWEECYQVAPNLLLLDSTETLSAVYHAIKWSLPDRETPLIVVPVTDLPKLRGLAPGTTTWLRERVPRT